MPSDRNDPYWSRQVSTPETAERQDPVIYGGSSHPGPLSPAELAEFDSRGFLILPGLFSNDEVAECLSEASRLSADAGIKSRPEAIVEPEGNDLRSLFAVHTDLSAHFAAVCHDTRILDVGRQILASDVYIHQSRINLKPGFSGKEFYWHSDFETWHTEDGMPRMRAVSCSLLLTDNHPFNGPLMLVPGSHKRYVRCVGETPDNHYQVSLRRQEIGVPDPNSLTRLVDQGGIEQATGRAGSVVVFDCNTMHGSASNISPFARSNLFVVLNSVENRLVAPYCGKPPRPDYIAAREDA